LNLDSSVGFREKDASHAAAKPALPPPRNPLPAAPGAIEVLEHRWGAPVAPLTAGGARPFDFVFGCDLMYVEEAAPALAATLAALAGAGRAAGAAAGGGGGAAGGEADEAAAAAREAGGGNTAAAAAATAASSSGRGQTQILIAHGRNRGAEPAFLRRCEGVFRVERVAGAELDPLYQCNDVDVLRLALLAGGEPVKGGGGGLTDEGRGCKEES
jgi:hypothetical protein